MDSSERSLADVQYRMNKKIAQLTKVIYQVNCRCEDSDAQLRTVTNEYESEVAQVMADARGKITALRDQLAAKKTDEKIAALVQSMSAQHDQARQAALRQFEEYKQEAAKSEQATRRAAEERIGAMTTELNQLKSDFAAKQNEFSAVALAGKGALAETIQQKDAELQRLVTEYNEKYKAMLAEQLAAQEALEAKLKAAHQSERDAMREAQAAALKQQRDAAAKEADRAAAAEARCSDLQETQKGLQLQLSQRTMDLETTQQQKQLMEERYAKLQQDLAGRTKEGDGLNASLVALQDELRAREADVAARNDTIAALEAQVTSLQEQKAKQQTFITALENEIAVLKKTSAALEAELQEERGRAGSLASDGDAASKRIAALQQDLSQLQATVTAKDGDLRSLTQALEAQRKEHEAARAAADAAHAEALAAAKAQAERHLEEQRVSFLNGQADAVGEMKRAHEKALSALQAELAAERAAAEAAAKGDAEANAAKQAALQQQLQDQATAERTRLEARITELERNHNAALQRASEELATVQGKLQMVQSQLASEQEARQQAGAASGAEASQLRAELAALRSAKEADAQAAAAALKKAADELDNAHSRIQTLQVRLEEAQAAAQREELRHAAELEALRSENSNALRSAGASADALTRDLENKLRREHAHATEQLVAVHERAMADKQAQLNRSQDALSLERSQRRDDEAAHSAALAEWAHKLELLQADHTAQVQAFEQRLSSTGDRAAKDRADLEDALQKATAEAAAAARAARESEAQLRSEHQAALAKAQSDAAEATAALTSNYQAKLEATTASKDREREKALADLNSRMSRSMQEAEDAANRRVEELEAQHGVLQREHDVLGQQKRTVDATAVQLRSDLQEIKTKLDREKELRRADALDAEARMREEQAAADRRRKELREALKGEHEQHLAALNDRFDAEREQWLQQQKQLKSHIADLEYRIANRESRREDVEKINELLRSSREKDAALLKAHQDLKQYKLDLMNKEQTYNKVFGRQPTVSSSEAGIAAGAAASGAGGPGSAPASATGMSKPLAGNTSLNPTPAGDRMRTKSLGGASTRRM